MKRRKQVDHAQKFATEADFEVCRRLHRQFGTTYYFATGRFPAEVRRRVHALYAFVRIPDEWVDNPGVMSLTERREKLHAFRRELVLGTEGVRPESPVLRAFCDVVREAGMPLDAPFEFLDAMEMDLDRSRYETYEDLRGYMRGSACAVAVMMCQVLGVSLSPETERSARALGEAMQLTNFLRDVAEDFERGRIYLPREDMASFEVSEGDVRSGQVSDRWRRLMKFEVERARALYREADTGLPQLPDKARQAVTLARVLYARILDRIEGRDFDVFRGRARTGSLEKLACAARVAMGMPIT